jgi:hypothetical protein
MVSLLVAIPGTDAHEPDGRVAIRYEWMTEATSDGSRPLRVSLTPVVALNDVRISAKIPERTSLLIRALNIAGRTPSTVADTHWPDAGLALGALSSGQTVVFELDVVEPPQGGGVLAIGLDGTAGERAVHEGIGVSVGTPGVVPTLRNGALEFPAEQGERAP